MMIHINPLTLILKLLPFIIFAVYVLIYKIYSIQISLLHTSQLKKIRKVLNSYINFKRSAPTVVIRKPETIDKQLDTVRRLFTVGNSLIGIY